jgi:glycopeptide antibiotics resistance protein
MREPFRIAHAVWALTTLFTILLTAAPFDFDWSLQAASEHLSRVRLNPLISPDTGRRTSVPDFVQNVLLFVPFGAAAVSAFGASRRAHAIGVAVSCGCVLSVGAESIQLLTRNRISSLGDVLSNTVGALTGAIAADLLSRGRPRAVLAGTVTTVTAAGPMHYPMLVTTLLVCVASWVPFDVTLDVGIVVGHVRALRASIWEPAVAVEHIIGFAEFLLFGFMLTQFLRDQHLRFAVIIGVCAAAMTGVALEISQIFVESRLPTFAALLANAAGAMTGAVASAVDGDVRNKLRTLTVVCLCAAAVAAVRWMYGRDAGFSAVRDIGVCVVGAYICTWSVARTLTTRRADHH